MSQVPMSKRTASKLKVFKRASKLVRHTCRICANKNNFPDYLSGIANQLTSTSMDIARLIWTANNVKVENLEDLNRRKSYQRQAHEQCESMLYLIDLAGKITHRSTDSILYWGGLTIDVETLLNAWRQSDYDRFKAQGRL